MRKPLIAGNWKMHGSLSQASSLIAGIEADLKAHPTITQHIDIAVLPPFVYLAAVKELLSDSNLQLGAQNLYLGAQGAFTGEVSGIMLKDIGCQYVLVGHSERRQFFHEDLTLTATKFQAALAAGLTPILCVGETLQERETNQTESIITMQLNAVLDLVGMAGFSAAVIAYEPVWAIGTGKTATPDQAQEMHAFIRNLLRRGPHAQNNLDIASTIRILYGGSMKAENAAQLLKMPDIDGGLIGGASLEANNFTAICQAALEYSTSLIKEH